MKVIWHWNEKVKPLKTSQQDNLVFRTPPLDNCVTLAALIDLSFLICKTGQILYIIYKAVVMIKWFRLCLDPKTVLRKECLMRIYNCYLSNNSIITSQVSGCSQWMDFCFLFVYFSLQWFSGGRNLFHRRNLGRVNCVGIKRAEQNSSNF